jgi:mRNA interferase ChpB
VKRGDIYMVSLNPSRGHEQQGHRPVVIISPTDFNAATKLPVVLPITTGGNFARRLGFAVELEGGKITGVVRCDQPRVLDIIERGGQKVDTLSDPVLSEVMARVVTIFQ